MEEAVTLVSGLRGRITAVCQALEGGVEEAVTPVSGHRGRITAVCQALVEGVVEAVTLASFTCTFWTSNYYTRDNYFKLRPRVCYAQG